MTHLFFNATQAAVVVFLVDFFSGVFHWLEDSYGSEETPVIGKLFVIPNVIHHQRPRDFVKSAFWQRNAVTVLLSVLIFAGVALMRGISWPLALFCVLGAACNEFHCWAHRSPEENGRWIDALHRLRLLQTPRHHAVHHTDPKNRAYCVLTNWTNPVLDRMEFWRRAEKAISIVFGIVPRGDS